MEEFETRSFKHATAKRGWDGPNHVSDAPEQPRTKSKKDTKKWCKGIVGREHKSVWVYIELVWGRRAGETFQEQPIPPLDRPTHDARGNKIYYHDPLATKYCTVCQKHIKYAENAYKLRRQGITILTKLPDPQ